MDTIPTWDKELTRKLQEVWMPAKFTQTVEYCAPCKWYVRKMIRSGQNPVYDEHCTHPTEIDVMGDRGRTIRGHRRPEWCPIRNKPDEEREAEDIG